MQGDVREQKVKDGREQRSMKWKGRVDPRQTVDDNGLLHRKGTNVRMAIASNMYRVTQRDLFLASATRYQ